MGIFGGCDSCTCGIGRCCGANLSIHWTFWFNWLFQVIFAVIFNAQSWKYILLIATVWGPACFLALLFHELGHIGATRCQRGTYTHSMLWPLGGFNDCTVPNGTCMQEFFIALCGPLMHIPLFFLWVIVLAVCTDEGVSYYGNPFSVDELNGGGADEWFAQLAKRSLDLNIMIFCLNLLVPAYPLDAATMVAAVCGHCGLSILSTAWVLVIIGGALGVVGLVIGIIFLVGGDGPGVFLLLLGLYVMYTSYQMYTMIQSGAITGHPIFKPDCFRKVDSRQTNLSGGNNNSPGHQPTPAANSRPSSPRKNGSLPSAKGSSKKPLPKRGNSQKRPMTGGDIETGNPGSSRKATPKQSTGGAPKKAPSKKQPSKKATPKKKPSAKKSAGPN